MSVNYTAYLIVGVRGDKLFTTSTDTKTVTKYDPDTGAPYHKQESTKVILLNGVPFGDELYEEEWAELNGLDCVSEPQGSDVGPDSYVFGKVLAETDIGEYIFAVTDKEITEAKKDVVRKLAAIGYTAGVQLYLVMNVG